MEPLEIILIAAFGFMGVSAGAYCWWQKRRPRGGGMKQSPSLDNLVIEDPQANDLTVNSQD